MKKLLVFAVLLMVPLGSAFQVYDFSAVQAGSSTDTVFKGSGAYFRLNVTDRYNYTINVSTSTGTYAETNMSLSESYNTSFEYVYDLNVSNMSEGEWRASVEAPFDGGSEVADQDFWIVGDRPQITGVNVPESVVVNKTFTAGVEVADSEQNMGNVVVDTSEGSYTMNRSSSGRISDYSAKLSLSELGTEELGFTATDLDSNQGTETTALKVKEVSSSDEADLNVTIRYGCSIYLNEFSMPQDGTIPVDSVGYFQTVLRNTGNLQANVTIPGLNVTDQGNNPYDFGEPKGPQILNYSGAFYQDVNISEQIAYQKQFNATYDPGYYAAHSEFQWRCKNPDYGLQEFNISIGKGFRITNSTGGGDDAGNQTTNQTYPSNSSEFDEKEETNDTIEGDNDAPGQTEIEVPEPVPNPVPEPIPMLSLDIEPNRREFNGSRGQYIPVTLNITNEGNTSVGGIRIRPQLAGRTGWEVQNAEVANLSTGEMVQRQVFIQPAQDAAPGYYVIPVTGENADNQLDLDYVTLRVTRQQFDTRVAITESPSSLIIDEGAVQNLPVLIRNTGREPLTNVTATLQNAEDCGISESETIPRLAENQTQSLSVIFNTTSTAQSCNATLIVSSEDRAYAFSDISFTVSEPDGLVSPEQRPPLIAVIWTAMLVIYAVARRKLGLDSTAINIPLVLLIIGEVVIALYLAVDAGVIQTGILPF